MRCEHTEVAPLRSSELARLVGVSTDTLRHYERKGLIVPLRAANGYRQYSHDAVKRVLLIRRALAIGFRLDDLARVLKARDRGGTPCKEVRTLAAAKLDALEEQIANLITLRDDLRATLAAWDMRLAGTITGERALLLEALMSPQSEAFTEGENL